MNLVLIGAGQRGMIYAGCACQQGHTIAAVAEPDDAVHRPVRPDGEAEGGKMAVTALHLDPGGPEDFLGGEGSGCQEKKERQYI